MLHKLSRRTPAALLLAFAVVGCEDAPQRSEGPPLLSKLPAKLCAQAQDGLERSSKTGAFEYEAGGSATIREDAWVTMGPQGQNDLTQALAVHAACKAGTVPREQQVFVRSEGGRTLSSRVVEIAPDAGMFFEEE
jgi:hypothetical protein